MDTRALARLGLVVGLVVLISSVVLTRRVHTEEQGMQFLLVAAMAAGGFLTISGLAGVLTQQPITEEEEEAALAAAELRIGAGVSVSTAIGVYLIALSLIAGLIVGIASKDSGAGIQTFTFGLILGGVIWGLGLLLGHRPVEE